ncbi:MAG: ion transporter [Methyloceanibacter sp.]|nr:ion transporter [Methyloceanibacter sp.]
MEWLRRIVQDPRTERFIMALIILTAVTLGLETSQSVMASFGPVLVTIDRIIIAIFVAEILARLAVQRWAFFRDGWNIFDFVVVGIALAPATAAFSVLRALRVLRLLRLITAVPALQRVVGGLISALPGMGSIVLLIGLVYYVSAVMAVNLYGKNFPELFGTLGTSLYTLFTIMTLEGWTNDVVNPILTKHPYALLFFIPFIVITTFWVLNLFIGIIVNAMQEEHAKAEAELMHEETAPLVREVQALRAEIAALRTEVSGRKLRSRS